MTISCSLGPQLKDEALNIDVKLLLNTEILKTVRDTLRNDNLFTFFLIAIATLTGLLPL